MEKSYRQRAISIAKKPLFRRLVIGLAAFLVLFGLFGYFVLPGIIKLQAETLIGDKLQRSVSIEKIEVSPFAMVLTVHKLKLMEPDGAKVFASFEELTVNVSAQSLFRFAPLVQEIHLSKPYLHLARTSANHYNVDDIIELIAKQPPSEHPARFSVHNIQIEGGLIEFDDHPEKTKHTIADLKLGIPFISSLSSQVENFVEPHLSAKVNGTSMDLSGKARPFAESRDAVIDIVLDGVHLPKYIDYLPFEPQFKLPDGKLDVRMTAQFQQGKDKPPGLMLKGIAHLKSLKITELDGKPMVKVPELAITLGDVNVFAGKIDIAKVVLNRPELNIVAERGGAFNLMRLSPHSSNQAAEKTTAARSSTNAMPGIHLNLHEFSIKDAALNYQDEQSARPMSADVEKFNFTIKNIVVDSHKREATIAEIDSGSASLKVMNDKSRKPSRPITGTGQKNRSTNTGPDDPSRFSVTVAKIAIVDWTARFEDRSLKKPVITVLSPLSLTAQDFSTKSGNKGTLELKATVNQTGSLMVTGAVAIAPLQADLTLNLKEVDILALQPYFTERVNLLVTRANISTNGSLQLRQGKHDTLNGEFKGDITLGQVATIDKLSTNDFVRWKSLFMGNVNAHLDPFSLTIDRVALNDFFARVIVNPKGRINLQDVVRDATGEKKSLTEANPKHEKDKPRWDAPVSPASTPSEPIATKRKQTTKMPPIKIRRLTMQGGKVRFTDNFIKPHYTANLVDLGGAITGLSSDAKSTANVDLRGKVNSAPLTIVGKINPLKRDLFLDVKAEVKGMELAPLTAYSGKYAGYGIEKGKLSFDVAYKLENRKLTAENHLILDQLTFGSKVDSPQATKLPVRLAVVLLRDRNGVIDLNLPISGSLDDPQFSVGGLIVKVIVNLLTKAVAAPFALLGSIVGGGEELSWLEFDPGRFAVTAAGETKLTSLAKALVDRPALKLEITGLTDPAVDNEGLARAGIDRKVRALKIKDMVAKGQSVPEGKLEVPPAEYPALLKRVYKDEDFKKPRNMVGLQKDLPVAEMEQLMIANAKVTPDDLIALGNQRAQAAKEWLITKGKVPAERIFILASKSGGDSKEKPSRVDFSLR